MGRLVRSAAFIAFVLLLPATAFAQASITGVVRDTSGAVLPGVTVEASSPALIEKVRSVATDGTGQYRIENLRPGTYVVTFTLPGFSTVKREGIELTGTFTASVNADLRVGSLEETITVTGETPMVDVQSMTRQQVIGRDVMDTLPTARTDRSVAALIPAVNISMRDVGGTVDTAISTLTVHGNADQRITLNGLVIAIAVASGGASAVVPNMAAMQEIAVDTGALDAELGIGGVRMAYVMKDGGNTFSGMVVGNFANEAMQGSNFTQELRDRGLRAPTVLKRIYDINGGFGGPIKRDRLWFYGAGRRMGRQNYPAGISYNLNANNPNVFAYVPDPDPERRPFNDIPRWNEQLRLTWQASAKNKISFVGVFDGVCYCPETISATEAPEAAIFRPIPKQRNLSAEWTAPLTNRLLLEAATFSRLEDVIRKAPPGTDPLTVSVTDQGLGNLIYRAPAAAGNVLRNTLYQTFRYRAATSYITGAHAFKVGINGGFASEDTDRIIATQPYEYRFNNGVPNQITMYAHPLTILFDNAEGGIYAQDKWTVGRLTLNLGLRYDFYNAHFPEQYLGPAPLIPTRNITLPATDGVSWSDLTPRIGAAYDLFGNGRTALKVTLNKYLEGMGSGGAFGNSLNPVGRLTLLTSRSWADANRNFVPDCDLVNAASNGECGAMADPNFGRPRPGANYDSEILTGWGHRGYNWEFSTGVQHEVLPRVSMDVSYFRRWFGNFYVTDNRAVAASDYTAFSFTAPSTDPRLPTAGQPITGLYDLNPARFGIPPDNFITRANNYGKQIQHWNGVDVTMNVRPRPGALLQGGLATGRTVRDNCEVAAQVPEVLLAGNVWTPLQFCHQQTPFLTQVKFMGAYTLPKVDVQVSGTLQNIFGPDINATYAAPNAVVAPFLGRNLAGNAANITMHLVSPGSLTNERMNQVDLRVAKILRFRRTRTLLNFDLFNAFNANPILGQNNAFGGRIAWQTPQSILNPRFFKVSAQFDF